MDRAHIIIVDDHSENIQVAMSLLKEDSYIFSFATNGQEAIDLISKKPESYDLVLLDIMMPGIDGFEVCRQLKANPATQKIPIIFLTARIDVDSIGKAFAIGGVDYIIKPFHSEELLARVRTHVELNDARKLLEKSNFELKERLIYGQQRFLSELESNQKDMIFTLTELMEVTSDETGKHIKRVAELSALLAYHHPSLDDDDVEILYHASPMHDIGKMTIPHEILHKPGKLTAEEFEVMKTHTTNGYNLLQHSDRKYVKAAAVIANQHHEMWNGQGYPQNLKEEEIHIYGRIVALVDVLDALTHKRCYKEAWSMDESLEYVASRKGVQFDPELVDIVIENIDEFKQILLDS